MEVSVLAVAESGYQPTRSLSTNGTYAAWVVEGTAIDVVLLLAKDLSSPPLRFVCESQQREILSICCCAGRLGSSDPRSRVVPAQLLVSASKDAVVIWRLEDAARAAASGQPLPPPVQVMAGQGSVDAIAVCSRTNLLALSVCGVVEVFDLGTLQHLYRLEGHTGPVFACAFFEPHNPQWLVTAGEDRTLRVWDLHEGQPQLLYSSHVLCAAPLTALSVDPSYPRVAVGGCDGGVRVLDLAGLPAVRLLQVIDTPNQLQRVQDAVAAASAQAAQATPAGPRVITAQPTRKPPAAPPAPALEASTCLTATSPAVLSLLYSPLRAATPGYGGELLDNPKLLVGLMGGISVIDTHTYDLVQVHYFRGGGQWATPGRAAQADAPPLVQAAQGVPELGVAGVCAFGVDPSDRHLVCCVGSEHEAEVGVLSLVPQLHQDQAAVLSMEEQQRYMAGMSEGAQVAGPCDGAGLPLLSVFQTRPLPDDSPLKPPLPTPSPTPSPSKGPTARQPSPARGACAPSPARAPSPSSGRPSGGATPPGSGAGSSGAPGLRRVSSTGSGASSSSTGSKALPNLPVTFHKKVKSSGYGFVQPAIKLGSRPPAPVKVSSRPVQNNAVSRNLMQAKQYPVTCAPPVQYQDHNRLSSKAPLHHGAVLKLRYSNDAARLLSCSADKTARVMSLPVHKFQGEGTSFAHSGAVLSADWSMDASFCITASSDRTARMWSAGFAQPLLEFSHVNQQKAKLPAAGASPAPVSGKPNPAFIHEVRAARFYYQDQFVLLATGNKMHLYRFKLSDGDPNDDIARLRNLNKYKLAASYTSAAQTVTDFAAVNAFPSPIAILAGSNRTLEVLDTTTMQCTAVLEDAHARPVNCVVQSASASMYTSHPKESMELFATTACDGLLKLWDVRLCRSVRAFSAHKNTQLTSVGAAFSPCMRFLACGSEDQAAYLYDLRQGAVLARMRAGHSDAVTDVAFSPLHPQLAVGCLDGHVHFYSDV